KIIMDDSDVLRCKWENSLMDDSDVLRCKWENSLAYYNLPNVEYVHDSITKKHLFLVTKLF
ncbi:hypothetical protein, partial [Absiella sp. AM54-8XD]|uniref:hypothetical protein n=1 Tax=Absiella sp. AM54-8XD TaxID=2292279 RepID=UPI001F4653C6